MVDSFAQMSELTPRVTPATLGDLAAARAIYADGRVRQHSQRSTVWPEFSDETIRREIDTHLLFLIVEELSLAGVFSVAYEDAAIWGEREKGEHIYLHRIVRARNYSGRIIDVVLEWADAHCRALGRVGLRMDTWANNRQLIAYYETFGFKLLGTRQIGLDPRLPSHYYGLEFALLERAVDPLP